LGILQYLSNIRFNLLVPAAYDIVHVCYVLFSHNEPITTFWSTQNDPSCHKTRFLGS